MIHDFLLFFINTQHVLSIPFTSIQLWANTYWLQLSGGISSAPTEVPLNLVTNWLLNNREERLICDFGLFDYPSQQLVNDANILYNFSNDIQKDIINVNRVKNYNVSVSNMYLIFLLCFTLRLLSLQNLRQDVVDSVAVITNYAYKSNPSAICDPDVISLNFYMRNPTISLFELDAVVNTVSRLVNTISMKGGRDVSFLFTTFKKYVDKLRLSFEQIDTSSVHTSSNTSVIEHSRHVTLDGWLDVNNIVKVSFLHSLLLSFLILIYLLYLQDTSNTPFGAYKHIPFDKVRSISSIIFLHNLLSAKTSMIFHRTCPSD